MEQHVRANRRRIRQRMKVNKRHGRACRCRAQMMTNDKTLLGGLGESKGRRETAMPEVAPTGQITIRRAQRADAPALLQLIVALAQFEKLQPPDREAQSRLIEDGFGERPRFEAWLGFWAGEPEPVAYALLFETYSSFLARPTLYLEAIFVLPAFRRRVRGQ